MESHQELMRIAHRSKCVTTVVEDYEFLATLLSHLLPIPEKEPVRDKIFDTGPVKAADLQTLYKISEKCDNVWTAREGIDWLLFYLFYRRYGWEDVTFHRDKVQLFAPSMIQRLRISSRAEELRFYERVKSVASDLITWFEQNPLRLASLKMMNSAIRIAKCAQTTRHFLILFTVRWLTQKLEDGANNTNSSSSQFDLLVLRKLSLRPSQTTHSPLLPEDATPESMFSAVQDLTLLGLTDSVHAIRFTAIPLVARLLDQLSLGTVQKFMDHIIELFNRQEVETWEVAEGLLNALGLLVKRMMPEAGHTHGSPTGMSSDTFEYHVLPRIKGLVYNLFDYEHPSVRSGAVQLLLTCLKRCQRTVIDQSLDEIMSELCVTVELNPTTMTAEQGPSLGVHATESLLSLCETLLKKFGSGNLPPSTGDLQNTLLRNYLGHPDQNVRLAASKVYETLIIIAFENQNRVRYLLSKIIENWTLRQDVLLAPLQRNFAVLNDPQTQTTPKTINPGVLTNWLDGRLYIFEKVCYAFVQNHCSSLYNQFLRFKCPDPSFPHAQQPVILENRRPTIYSSGALKSPGTPPGRLGKGSTFEARLSISLDDDGILTQRSESQMLPRSASIIRRMNIGMKKEQLAHLSALDHLRLSDETDKNKQLDAARFSLWHSQILRQLSTVARKSSLGTITMSAGGNTTTSRLRILISTMLHACCENLVAEPRELRQRARQAFPEVARFITWYDAEIFGELISSHLTFQTTLMTYSCLKILRSFVENICTFERSMVSTEMPDFTGSDHSLRSTDSADGTPEGCFLNVPMFRLLLGIERSTTWLRACQQYLTNDVVPTFITLPAFDCVITTLSFVHSLPRLISAAKHVESSRPPLTTVAEKLDAPRLAIDPGALADAIRAATNFTRRFEVRLDKHFKPTTVNSEHLKIMSLRPFSAPRTSEKDLKEEARRRAAILAPVLARVISTLERILFPFLPPTPNASKPDPLVRRTAGFMMAPMLFNLITWPIALLPPEAANGKPISPGKNETRLLAVRKLLRIVASIVHALPSVKFGWTKPELSASEDRDFALKLEEIAESRIDMTSTVNSYFTQLESVFGQLSEACTPTLLCLSSSWWWFRALCEHMPRLLQVAPHSNPVSLLRLLMKEVSRLSKSELPQGEMDSQTTAPIADSKKMLHLWNKAIDFAKQKASPKTPEISSPELGYRWSTVGDAVQLPQRQRQSQHSVNLVNKEPADQEDAEEEKRAFFLEQEKPSGIPQTPNSRNPAFDYMSEEDESFTLERAEPDSSSGEEQLINRTSVNKHRISIARPSRRRRYISTSMIKPQAIETPPPFEDILGLVKRVWTYCEPITVRTLKNLLSADELSLIVWDGSGPAGKVHAHM